MGFLTSFLQKTSDIAVGILIFASVVNILFDAVIASIPDFYFSAQNAQLLSYVYGLSLTSSLIGLTNNPFFGAVANAVVALLVAILREQVLSNLPSSTQISAQTLFILAYIIFIYTNAIFFFAHWILLTVQGSNIAPTVKVFVDVLISVFSVAEILYMLMVLGYIPPDV